MRRKRRQSTQIIRKKTDQHPPVIDYYSSRKSSGRGRKIFSAFLAIVVLGSISYYVYDLNFTDEKSATTAGEEQTVVSSKEPEQTDEPEHPPPPFEHNIQIEILNGCGINGVAKIFQSFLRQQGFDVANTENYRVDGRIYWKVEESFVIDQIGVEENAKAVAKSLGLPSSKVESRENPNAIYDISVVIGKDYKKLIPQD